MLTETYDDLAGRYNTAVRRTAMTELVVQNGTLSVVVQSAAGRITDITTPYDPASEIYVDYAIIGGRVWIRRIFDEHTAPAEAMVIAQKPRIAAFAADNGQDLLLAGEVDLAMEWNGDILQAAEEDDDISYVLPKEGGLRWEDTLCIPKGAPNVDNAHALINYIHDAEAHAVADESTSSGSSENWLLLRSISVRLGIADLTAAAKPAGSLLRLHAAKWRRPFLLPSAIFCFHRSLPPSML